MEIKTKREFALAIRRLKRLHTEAYQIEDTVKNFPSDPLYKQIRSEIDQVSSAAKMYEEQYASADRESRRSAIMRKLSSTAKRLLWDQVNDHLEDMCRLLAGCEMDSRRLSESEFREYSELEKEAESAAFRLQKEADMPKLKLGPQAPRGERLMAFRQWLTDYDNYPSGFSGPIRGNPHKAAW